MSFVVMGGMRTLFGGAIQLVEWLFTCSLAHDWHFSERMLVWSYVTLHRTLSTERNVALAP